MAAELPASARRVQAAVAARGFAFQVIKFPASTRTAADAAAAVGCEVAQIAKSLIFRTKETQEPILVIASGVNRVNENRLRELVGAPIEKADADFVRERIGFAIGGVPPVGHHAAVSTYIDEDLLDLGEIWAAAGTPNAVFRLPAADLVALTGGQIVSIK